MPSKPVATIQLCVASLPDSKSTLCANYETLQGKELRIDQVNFLKRVKLRPNPQICNVFFISHALTISLNSVFCCRGPKKASSRQPFKRKPQASKLTSKIFLTYFIIGLRDRIMKFENILQSPENFKKQGEESTTVDFQRVSFLVPKIHNTYKLAKQYHSYSKIIYYERGMILRGIKPIGINI